LDARYFFLYFSPANSTANQTASGKTDISPRLKFALNIKYHLPPHLIPDSGFAIAETIQEEPFSDIFAAWQKRWHLEAAVHDRRNIRAKEFSNRQTRFPPSVGTHSPKRRNSVVMCSHI
jgi:hypothetical protein